MIIKSKIKDSIISFKWSVTVVFIYAISYNSYFGWNEKPINNAEDICDAILGGLFGFLIGWFIKIVLDYMEYKMNCATLKAYQDEINKLK